MKSRDEHLKQAKSNEEHADFLLQTARAGPLQWAVTALFYSAAHYGRAFLACKVPTITGHIGFESHFRRHWKTTLTPDIFSLYRRLKDESEAGGYDCVPYSDTEVKVLRDSCLVPFRDAVQNALGLKP